MPFCVITGASTGIGRELARICAAEGHRLLLVADEPAVSDVAAELGAQPLVADLATDAGVRAVVAAVQGQPVDMLFLNAGRSLGHAFLEQSESDILRVIDLNVRGTVQLAHAFGGAMAMRGQGRILITGSIVGFMPGPFQLVYNATKAFLNSFAIGLAHEVAERGVTVTCLMPGATETEVFRRAGMEHTPVGQMKKADPADVARAGYDALVSGREQVTPGLMNKVQATAAEVLPADMVARMHRKITEPKD